MRLFPLFFYAQKGAHAIILISLVVISVVLFSSCRVTRPSNYFQEISKDTTIQGFVTNSFESKIQKSDVLVIKISSLSKELDEKFNAPVVPTGNAVTGYPVDDQGKILVHYLGNVEVAGLTRKELQDKLQTALAPFLKEPIVIVQYLNHKVTVLGAVARPQVITMPEEQLPLMDVIVTSGDLTTNANRRDIMVVRENGNEKTIKHLNLENYTVLSSPWYYVQPNDIVYVLNDYEKIQQEERRQKTTANTYLAISVITLMVIVLDRVIK